MTEVVNSVINGNGDGLMVYGDFMASNVLRKIDTGVKGKHNVDRLRLIVGSDAIDSSAGLVSLKATM